MDRIIAVLDRTLVLFIGVAVGMVVGLAFVGGGGSEAVANAPDPVIITSDEEAEEAAPAGECAAPYNDRLMTSLAEGDPVHIGVFGDSFGDGLWGALYRDFRSNDDFVVHRFAQQSTGFTRYRTLNVLEDVREKIAEQPIDIAVISFGANDTDGLWADGTATEYMSEQWQEVVGDRVEQVVQTLRDHGAIVYWVGLPRMQRPAFDAQIRQMNAFYENKMRELGVPYFETVSESVDEEGNYTAYMPNPDTGDRTLIRAGDGIHMTGIGYSFLIRDLEARITDYVETARAEARREADRRQAGRARSDGRNEG